MHFYRDGWPAIGRSSFFLMSGDDGDGGGDRFGVWWWCVRDNLADFYLFRLLSGVYLFFCLEKSHKLLVNYKT